MVARCSDRTVLHRSGGGSPDSVRRWLRSLPDRTGHTTVAGWRDRRLVGMTTAVQDDGRIEPAVVVEDAWQRRGVGTALVSRLWPAWQSRCRCMRMSQWPTPRPWPYYAASPRQRGTARPMPV
ncbi:GNAT family N-acetyltransferase [Saccharothrix xinjiangensis]|uniref:GNAT family N-acetyltransferase n=1 Tax=Saccharothrix xinjiangensis TaxID=204798 RepID=A0ABV9XV64_9PSEU